MSEKMLVGCVVRPVQACMKDGGREYFHMLVKGLDGKVVRFLRRQQPEPCFALLELPKEDDWPSVFAVSAGVAETLIGEPLEARMRLDELVRITPQNLGCLGVALAHQCNVPETDVKAIAGMVDMVRIVQQGLSDQPDFRHYDDMKNTGWSFMLASTIVSASYMNKGRGEPPLAACDDMHEKVKRAVATLETEESHALASAILSGLPVKQR